MKKINVSMLAVLVLFAGFFGSCKKDQTNDASISLAGDTGYTATDATLTAGSTFKVKWTATSTIDMKYVSITKDDAILASWNNIEIPSASSTTYINEATLTVPVSGGPYTYAIIVYDKNNAELARKEIVITVGSAGNALTSYTDKILGAQTSSNGSSFLSVDGTVLQIADAKANSNKVDFMYYYSSGDQSAIVAPSDASAATQFNNANTGVATWSVKNATKLKKLTGVTFENITNSSAIDDVSSTGSTKVSALAVGDVVAFMTASTSAKASKKGVFKVTNISAATTAGSVTIQVKVEQ